MPLEGSPGRPPPPGSQHRARARGDVVPPPHRTRPTVRCPTLAQHRWQSAARGSACRAMRSVWDLAPRGRPSSLRDARAVVARRAARSSSCWSSLCRDDRRARTSSCLPARMSYADPRYVLKRTLQSAAHQGFTFYTHHEIEFYLFKGQPEPGHPPVPVDQSGCFDHTAQSAGSDFRREARRRAGWARRRWASPRPIRAMTWKGWDASVKATVLANVLIGRRSAPGGCAPRGAWTPGDAPRAGGACSPGRTLKQMVEVSREGVRDHRTRLHRRAAGGARFWGGCPAWRRGYN